ncbi:MAG: hypothetical protein KDD42_03750 [Bdellovibrionales bacterium]|nr:hypothetical protein [Bdellovibrionales bacterium]
MQRFLVFTVFFILCGAAPLGEARAQGADFNRKQKAFVVRQVKLVQKKVRKSYAKLFSSTEKLEAQVDKKSNKRAKKLTQSTEKSLLEEFGGVDGGSILGSILGDDAFGDIFGGFVDFVGPFFPGIPFEAQALLSIEELRELAAQSGYTGDALRHFRDLMQTYLGEVQNELFYEGITGQEVLQNTRGILQRYAQRLTVVVSRLSAIPGEKEALREAIETLEEEIEAEEENDPVDENRIQQLRAEIDAKKAEIDALIKEEVLLKVEKKFIEDVVFVDLGLLGQFLENGVPLESLKIYQYIVDARETIEELQEAEERFRRLKETLENFDLSFKDIKDRLNEIKSRFLGAWEELKDLSPDKIIDEYNDVKSKIDPVLSALKSGEFSELVDVIDNLGGIQNLVDEVKSYLGGAPGCSFDLARRSRRARVSRGGSASWNVMKANLIRARKEVERTIDARLDNATRQTCGSTSIYDEQQIIKEQLKGVLARK